MIMAFIRTKQIKGKHYAYLIENKWTPQGPRQGSTKYLGRVIFMQKVRDLPFSTQFPHYQPNEKSKIELLSAVITTNLLEYGFVCKKQVLKKGDILFDPAAMILQKKNKKVIALGINEGILCANTIARILAYLKSEDDTGYLLAKYCVEAGLTVPKDIFVALYEASCAPSG